MNLQNLLKRLRGDVFLRQQIAPLRRSVLDVRVDLAELTQRLGTLEQSTNAAQPSAGGPNPRSADHIPPKAPSTAQPSQADPPVQKLISTHFRGQPYLSRVLRGYEEWVHAWLAIEQPWYTGGATRWLEQHLSEVDRVFEYGAGRSTVWWCRNVGSVTTVEASPEWIAFLNFYVAERPELMARLQMVHVPADWNPDVETGAKWYWGRRREHLTPEVVDALERKYLMVDSGSPTVVAFDGSVRALTMAMWALDGRGGRGADIVVVDNTEKGRMSSLAAAIVPDYVRLDFPFGPGDVVPEGQHGKHVTTVFVRPERMERCDRGEAIPDDTDLFPHQSSPDYDADELRSVLDKFSERLDALGVFV